MSKASKSDKPANSAAAPTSSKKTPKEFGYELPERLFIVGKDTGFMEGEPGYDPQLLDPDRLEDPDDAYVKNILEHGHFKPVIVVTRMLGSLGKCKIVVDGRQHVMGARLANDQIGEKADPIQVPWFDKGEANALDVTRANEWARVDSPLQKARRAVRLLALEYTEKQVIAAFSNNGREPITKMTLINWKRAANCCMSLQSMFENGDIPITTLYELGKIGYGKSKMDPIEKAQKQLEAFETMQAAGSTDGAAETDGDESEEGGGDGDGSGSSESTGGRVGKVRSLRLSHTSVRELNAAFAPDEETVYTDRTKDGAKEYQDGDFQKLTAALLGIHAGTDPEGKALREFPSVHRHFKKYLRSATA
jgi:hypothetical protein